MRSKFSKIVHDYFFVIFAASINAVLMRVFIIPNNFVPGGLSGIGALMEYSGILKAQYAIFLLNIPLLILAIIMLKGDFTVKTIVATLLGSVFLEILDQINFFTFSEDKLVAACFGGVMSGITLHFAFEVNGSNGGTEIIARLVQKKNPETNVAKLLTTINFFIMGIGGFFTGSEQTYNLWAVAFSLIYTCVSMVTYQFLLRGIDPAIRFTIITKKPEEISSALMVLFKRGVTEIELNRKQEDGYAMLVVVVQFRQTYKLKRILSKIDSNCFAYSQSVSNFVTRPDFNKRYK